jgi:hypothetical protein
LAKRRETSSKGRSTWRVAETYNSKWRATVEIAQGEFVLQWFAHALLHIALSVALRHPPRMNNGGGTAVARTDQLRFCSTTPGGCGKFLAR